MKKTNLEEKEEVEGTKDVTDQLMMQASQGNWRAVKALLISGADRTVADHQGLTALHIATYFCHVKVVQVLLAEAEASELLITTVRDGLTCMHFASKYGNVEIVKLLAEAGGETLLLKTTFEGATALHYACENGKADIVRTLLSFAQNTTAPVRSKVVCIHSNELISNVMMTVFLFAESFPPICHRHRNVRSALGS